MGLLKDPFRPYFILAALLAVIVPMYFVGVLLNDYSFNEEIISSFAWHGHEMVFGFTSAVVTGFLLTASAKWTGRSTFTPVELVASIVVWLFSRYIVIAQPSEILIMIFAPLPFIYILLKMLYILRAQKNFLPVNSVLVILLISNFIQLKGSFNADQDLVDMSYKVAGLAIFSLLYIFTGKLITFFTNNKFKEQLITLGNKENMITLLICNLTFLADIFSLIQVEKILAVVCVVLLSRRSYKLLPKNVIKTPMLFILSS